MCSGRQQQRGGSIAELQQAALAAGAACPWAAAAQPATQQCCAACLGQCEMCEEAKAWLGVLTCVAGLLLLCACACRQLH